MPPTFITAAASMKKGIASSVKELSEAPMFCASVTSRIGLAEANAVNVPRISENATGTPKRIAPSPTPTSTQGPEDEE